VTTLALEFGFTEPLVRALLEAVAGERSDRAWVTRGARLWVEEARAVNLVELL
jgi:hypothetical protein